MDHSVRVAAVIAAGGRGRRSGGGVPKQFRRAGGRTLLEHGVAPFDRHDRVAELIVVLPADAAQSPPPGLAACASPVRVVAGGARRQDSVAAGVDAVGEGADIVLVHDAARPFCSAALIDRVIDAAAETGAAVPALRATDTVKEAAGMADPAMAAAGAADPVMVAATLPRDRIWLAQTPQGFRLDVLREAVALGRKGVEATDEALLAERAGHPVRLVEGDPANVKVTTAADVDEAMARLGTGGGAVRIGFGYDSHRTEAGRPLILGGIEIPHDVGLAGHSDADGVCHAVTDALLGAAAAGDIGRHFPDTDPRWKGASSIELLRGAVAIVRAHGFAPGNVDVVVIAQRPKLGPHVEAMRERLSDPLGIPPGAISIKAKTAEGMDAVGRGEGIVVHAVATVVPVVRDVPAP
ncbi:MAG: 2-C-methyl-D-erythritol 2,4-cyclodiphosphate synthase [Acidobacteria bacterium]|nr:2-C-methyl-D-erythritol 2,4-cyclodiphosphate synthase [Acidobacteriota bacterium]MYJ06188.1 2-C-methyl-D-erythritol 2,4-cyclodiphosphate synthase [Acidobacteriota bacterium]